MQRHGLVLVEVPNVLDVRRQMSEQETLLLFDLLGDLD